MELSLFFLWNPLVGLLSDGILKERRIAFQNPSCVLDNHEKDLFSQRRDVLYFRDIAVESFMTFSEIRVPCQNSRKESCFCILLSVITPVASKCIFQVSNEMKWAISAARKLVQTMLSTHFHHLFTSGWKSSYSIDFEFHFGHKFLRRTIYWFQHYLNRYFWEKSSSLKHY